MNDSAAGRVVTVLFTLVLFAVILYLAYLASRYIGKKYSVHGGMSGKNIKILDTLAVSQDKLLMIVKAGGKTVLMGVSKDHMDYICDVDGDQIIQGSGADDASLTPDFVQAFRNVLNDKMKNLKHKENSDEENKQ